MPELLVDARVFHACGVLREHLANHKHGTRVCICETETDPASRSRALAHANQVQPARRSALLCGQGQCPYRCGSGDGWAFDLWRLPNILCNADLPAPLIFIRIRCFAVWFANNGERLGTYKGHNGACWSVDVDWNTKNVVTGSADNTARVWDCQTGMWWKHCAMHLVSCVDRTTVRRSIMYLNPDFLSTDLKPFTFQALSCSRSTQRPLCAV